MTREAPARRGDAPENRRGIDAAAGRARPALPSLRFLLLFAGGFVVLYWLYRRIPDELLAHSFYPRVLAQPAAIVINALAPAEAVAVQESGLSAARVSLSIVRGCDGAGAFFLLLAAIAAYPARWTAKLTGTLGAAALIYVLNEARIVALYFVIAYRGAWLTTVHVYLLPLLLIAGAATFFVAWAPPLHAAHRS